MASTPATLTICASDFDCDGNIDSQDFFSFLDAFFDEGRRADINGDGAISSQDFFDFLTQFFSGC